MDSDFKISCRLYSDFPRYLNKGLFYRTMRNGEKQLRQFLVYSESRGSVFAKRSEGFNDWKNGQSRLTAHENSVEQRKCVLHLRARDRWRDG